MQDDEKKIEKITEEEEIGTDTNHDNLSFGFASLAVAISVVSSMKMDVMYIHDIPMPINNVAHGIFIIAGTIFGYIGLSIGEKIYKNYLVEFTKNNPILEKIIYYGSLGACLMIGLSISKKIVTFSFEQLVNAYLWL